MSGTGPEYTFFAYMGIASALVFASKYYFIFIDQASSGHQVVNLTL